MDDNTIIQVKNQSKNLLFEVQRQERVLKGENETGMKVTEEELNNANIKKRILLSNSKRSKSFLRWFFNNREL